MAVGSGRRSGHRPARDQEQVRRPDLSLVAQFVDWRGSIAEPRFFGSSHNTGEGVADFEEEERVVAKAVCHGLDALDLVVEAFQQAGVQWPVGVCEAACQLWQKFSGEGNKGGDAAFDGAINPVFPSISDATFFAGATGP